MTSVKADMAALRDETGSYYRWQRSVVRTWVPYFKVLPLWACLFRGRTPADSLTAFVKSCLGTCLSFNRDVASRFGQSIDKELGGQI